MRILFLLLLPLSLIAQKKSAGYGLIRGGISPKSNEVKGMAFVSFGAEAGKSMGLGFGVGYINYDRPYLPFTFDVTYFGKKGKFTPLIIAQAGYGVYNYKVSVVTLRGGFTGSLSAGFAAPLKNHKLLFSIGIHNFGFTSYTTLNGRQQVVHSDQTRPVITVGVRL